MSHWIVIVSLLACGGPTGCGGGGSNTPDSPPQDGPSGDDAPDSASDAALSALAQKAYIKASNTGTEGFDQFGISVALSADGSTLAVGAPGEDSVATGIDGDQADNSASGAGAVHVFTRTGTTWSQQAYVKASNTDADDGFGFSVALSSDGSTLAVGAYQEGSVATGVDGNQADNSASRAGAVYVFAHWPQWQPGRQHGRHRRCGLRVPVRSQPMERAASRISSIRTRKIAEPG